jgi:hypothetical protein
MNAALFMNSYPIAMKIVEANEGGFVPWSNGIADGLAQASPGNLAQMDDFTGSAIEEVRRLYQLHQPDRCVVLVASLGSSLHYRFLNSRIASYYFPDSPIWILADEEPAPRVTLMKGRNFLDLRFGPVIDIRVPRDSRIVWLTDSAGPLRAALGSIAIPTRIPSVLHTDFTVSSPAVQVLSFRFLPDQQSCKAGSPAQTSQR